MSVVSVKDDADHIVIVIHLCEHQFHIWIIVVKFVKFRFQRLKVVIAAGNADYKSKTKEVTFKMIVK